MVAFEAVSTDEPPLLDGPPLLTDLEPPPLLDAPHAPPAAPPVAEAPRRGCQEIAGAGAPLLLLRPLLGVRRLELRRLMKDAGAQVAAASGITYEAFLQDFANDCLTKELQTVEQVQDSINPQLDIQGIVLTMYDGRNNLANQVVEDVRAHMGEKVYETVIPRNVRVSEAPSYGKPAILYDLKCAGSQAYLQLASEVIRRERRLRAA